MGTTVVGRAAIAALLCTTLIGCRPPIGDYIEDEFFTARNDSSGPVTVKLYDGSDLLSFAEVPPSDVFGFAMDGCQGTEVRVLDAAGKRLAVVQRPACQDKQIVISADLQVRYENYRRPET